MHYKPSEFLSKLAVECEHNGGEYGKGRASGIRDVLGDLITVEAANADHADRLAKLERFYAAYIERLNAIAGCSSDPEHGSTRIDAAYTEFQNAAADLKGKP